MHSVPNRPMIFRWFLLGSLFFQALSGATRAEEHSIRHEIRASLDWFAEEIYYDRYISGGEVNPLKTESFEKYPFLLTGAYTLFLAPLKPDPKLPASLWEFYQRPAKAGLTLMLQPEARIRHDDRSPIYHHRTTTDERLRSLTAGGEYYLLPRTGLSITVAENMAHEHSATRTEPDDRILRTGSYEGLRRQYGLGLSHYPNEHINVRIGYERLSGEYRRRERNRDEENPPAETRYYTDSELAGHHLSIEGMSVFKTFLSLHARYDFRTSVLDADYMPVFSKELVGQQFRFKDTLTHQAVSLQLSLYPVPHISVWGRGTYAHENIRRTYATLSDTLTADRHQTQFQTGIAYDFTRLFSLQVAYAYLHQGGDVRIADRFEPESAITYDTMRDRHAVSLGVIGRF